MVRNSLLITVAFLFPLSCAYSQLRFIYLTDKKNNSYSISKPEEFLSAKSIKRRAAQGIAVIEKDLPVSVNYVNQIANAGAKVIYRSKWNNGLLIDATDEVYNSLKNFGFVKTDNEIVFKRKKLGNFRINGKKEFKGFREDYGSSLAQNQMLGVDEMHKEGFRGEGMTIAVLDAGFYKVDEIPAFDSLVKGNRIIDTYDFVNKEKEVFSDDSHGMQVLSTIAGYKEGSLIGTAYKANFILLKTEDVTRESRVEEVYWTVGAEYADSIGADIITTSLGYNYFDIASENYLKEDLDGNTAMITKAADYAASIGMLVVVSAGNEGNESWGTITVPADGDSVLSVGAVNSLREYVGFSSRGNTADNQIKPDVVGLGAGTIVATSSGDVVPNNGTSFSAPVTAGFAAGLWQAFPELKASELLDVIRKSGDNVEAPDSLRGYGIPSYIVAKKMIINGVDNPEKSETVVFPNPLNETNLIIKDTNFINGESVKVYLYTETDISLLNKELKVKNKEIVIDGKSLSTLSPGTYLLRFVSKKNKSLKKLIKL